MWTGYYWIHDESHVVNATIYAPDDSYAMKYAQKYNIVCNVNNDNSKNNVSILDATVSGIKSNYVYCGKAIAPEAKVKLDNKILKKGTDYTVSYVNNTKTGKATVKITGIHNYSGTVTKTFKIIPKRVSILKLVSKKSKTIRLTWKKDVQASGYQIQYAKNAKFTSGRKTITVKKKSAVSRKISKLMRHKKYYVRICAYKIIDGKKYCGSWSKTKKVKCK